MSLSPVQMWHETAWHLAFLPSASSPLPPMERWLDLLEALDSVGYNGVGHLLDACEKAETSSHNENESSTPDSQARVKAALVEAFTAVAEQPGSSAASHACSWVEMFKSLCAASSSPLSASSSDTTTEACSHPYRTLAAHLHTLRVRLHCDKPDVRTPLCFLHSGALGNSFFDALAPVQEEEEEKGAASISSSSRAPRLSPLFDLVPLPEVASSETHRTAFTRFRSTWQRARLYAALLCHQHHVCGRAASGGLDALARWLARYVHLHHTPKPRATDITEETLAAMYGVVAGILEFALATTRALPEYRQRLLDVWTQASTAAGSLSTSCVLQEEEMMTTAALLLTKLVSFCSVYEIESRQDGCEGSASVAATAAASPLATLCATHVVHIVHELLFALVLGSDTRALPARPSTPPVSASAKVKAVQSIVLNHTAALSVCPLVATSRGLVVNEADAVVQILFPALLQQLGVEWPWSALLRFLRQLSKHQKVPAPMLPSSTHNNNNTDADEAQALPALTVAWSCGLLLDTLFKALAQRTYPARLHNLLPGSYTTVLESLGLLPPRNTAEDDQDGATNNNSSKNRSSGEPGASQTAQTLFQFPLYYQAAGEALVEHFLRCEGPGGRGVRVNETEALLTRVTASLPVLVQLRARAPTTTSDVSSTSPPHTHADSASVRVRESGSSLSAQRVEALQCRYRAEVLLAAVVVYTQLETPSRVQLFMRALAPLFDSLCSRMQQAGGGSFPLLVSAATSSGSSSPAKLVFTQEACTLLDHVGYQFYPLEWLPNVAGFYHEWQNQSRHQSQPQGLAAVATTSSSSSSAWSETLPYSLWAAVAHQLGVSLRFGADESGSGSAGLVSERGSLVCGERAPVCQPRFSASAVGTPVRGSLWEYVDGPVAAAVVRQLEHDNRTAPPGAAWKRSERFFHTLMNGSTTFLASRFSACDLEGTLAVALTRRLGNNHSNAGGALSLMPPSTSPVTDRVRHFFTRSHLLEQLYREVTAVETAQLQEEIKTKTTTMAAAAPVGVKRERDEEEEGEGDAGEEVVAAQDASVSIDEYEQLAALLLREGATSFYDVSFEARDVLLTLAGAFLPSTRVLSVAVQSCLRSTALRPLGAPRKQPQHVTSTSSSSSPAEAASEAMSPSLSQRLLLAGWKWSEEAVMGGVATADRVRVCQGLEQHAQEKSGLAGHASARVREQQRRRFWWCTVATHMNSGTFDAVPLARDVLRLTVARLVEKIAHGQHEAQLFASALDKVRLRLRLRRRAAALMNTDEKQANEEDCAERSRDAGGVAESRVSPDPLLVHQWLEFQDVLSRLGLGLNDAEAATTNVHARATAAMWLWGSPFTSSANGL